jgi:limonene-1,2-epoxide hydrolase
MTAGDVVASLIKANESLDVDAVVAVMTDDVEYENVGMGVCRGPDEVRALLGAFFASAESMSWEVLAQVEQGDTVMNERVDHFFMPGGKQVDVRVAGYFEVKGDRVRRWRDYFDTAPLLSALSG